MVYINYSHMNYPAPPGTFGGAICMCSKCCEKRRAETEKPKDAIEILQEVQLGNEAP
jgi:hypothetical protein